MFEEFSTDARRLLMESRQHAWLLCSSEINPEHLILAAAVTDTQIGSLLRHHFAGQLADLWAAVLSDSRRPDPAANMLTIPFSARTRALFDLALERQAGGRETTLGRLLVLAFKQSRVLKLPDELAEMLAGRDD